MIEVKGNGNIVSREIKVSSFIRLHLSGKGTIELHQSGEEKVIVETDENLQEYFEIINSGRTLYISAEAKFRRPVYTKCRIKVFLRQIDTLYIRNEKADVVCADEISLSQPIEIKVQTIGDADLNIVAPAIRILSQSVGNVVVKGRCGRVDIKNQSEGNFNSMALMADELTIKNMAEGNVEVFANKAIAISHYGEGYIHYAGNAVLKDVKQYGQGVIEHVNG
jgi:Putative auto-transporter adhesin, head GIN domain